MKGHKPKTFGQMIYRIAENYIITLSPKNPIKNPLLLYPITV